MAKDIKKPLDAKKLKQELEALTASVCQMLRCIDKIMEGPSTPERGRMLSAVCNALEMANDRTCHFGLGMSFEKINSRKAEHKAKAERGLSIENVAETIRQIERYAGKGQ